MDTALSLLRKLSKAFVLFVLLPIFLLLNTCGASISEERAKAGSGLLMAKVILLNPGAMSDYSGSVWVRPKYFPPIWPFDILVGCRALLFDSDPAIDLKWQDETLVVTHDPLRGFVAKQTRCYGRDVLFRERKPSADGQVQPEGEGPMR